ncbi:hypothetical protein HMPREF3036_01452 [Sutterella sp. KLE1602]|nr:hypothetical protein HMPREF3036_01452 [Sutterella sp. KLE1602]
MQAREQTNEQALRIIRFLFTGVGLRIPSTAPFHVQERLMNILKQSRREPSEP